MKIDTLLSEKFDLMEPVLGEVITNAGDLILPPVKNDDELIYYDYNKSRTNIHHLLDQGQDALYTALEVAKQSENPRAFEVVANMIKQLADINLQLMDLTEKKQKLVQKKEEVVANITNNAIFVGSTNELFKNLKNTL